MSERGKRVRAAGAWVVGASALAWGCGGAAERWEALDAEAAPPDHGLAADTLVSDDMGELAAPREGAPREAAESPTTQRFRRPEGPTARIEEGRTDQAAHAPIDVTFVSWTVVGLESRVAAATLRAAQADVALCARNASTPAGFVTLSFDVGTDGRAQRIESKGELGAALALCLERVASGLTLGKPLVPKASMATTIRLAPPGSEPPGLPAIADDEELVTLEGGACAGVERFDCPKGKECAATTRRPVACPQDRGLVPMLEIADAERRVDVGVSGGKTGQGSQRLVFSAAAGRCSITKMVDEPSTTPPTIARETRDAPCARFADAWALFERKLRGKSAKGAPHEHAHVRTASTWQRGRPGVQPTVTEARWSVDDATLDASFEELVGVVGGVSKAAGGLAAPRLER